MCDVKLTVKDVPIELFDWEYYVQKNPDLQKAGINNLEKSYRHWIRYGCHENRWIKSKLNGIESQIHLNERHNIQSTNVVSHIDPIHLSYKVAIMIHIFDVTMMRFFVKYIDYLDSRYDYHSFDIYLNVVAENQPYTGDLRSYVQSYISQIKRDNIVCNYSENRGGDIGGFLLLSKAVVKSLINYKYVIFVHSKKKSEWRKELCHCIFDIKFEQLENVTDVGIISAKKWVYVFDPNKQVDEVKKFKYHLIELSSTYELTYDKIWSFIAGTMFLANISIIRYIVSHSVDYVYRSLNRPESVDINWLLVTDQLKKDRKGTTNDYQYRIKYGKSLLSDYMIEHTFERIIGLICNKLQLKIIGQ